MLSLLSLKSRCCWSLFALSSEFCMICPLTVLALNLLSTDIRFDAVCTTLVITLCTKCSVKCVFAHLCYLPPDRLLKISKTVSLPSRLKITTNECSGNHPRCFMKTNYAERVHKDAVHIFIANRCRQDYEHTPSHTLNGPFVPT